MMAMISTPLYLLTSLVMVFSLACSSSQSAADVGVIDAETILRQLAKGEPVNISDITIRGDLDLTRLESKSQISVNHFRIEVPTSLYLERCRIEGDLIAYREEDNVKYSCEWTAPVILEQCMVKGAWHIEQSHFQAEFALRSTNIEKDLILRQSVFARGADLYKSSIDGNLFAQRCHLGLDFIARELYVGGQLHLQGSDFVGNCFMPTMTISDYADFSLCHFRSAFMGDYSQFEGRSSFGGATFAMTSHCQSCVFVGDLDLSKAFFARIPMWKDVQIEASAKMNQIHPSDLSDHIAPK